MKITFILIFAIFSLLIIPQVSSLNLSAEEQVKSCLESSAVILNEMHDLGFSVIRINDTLREANNLYSAQVILKAKKKSADFSFILPYCEEISSVKISALNARDEFLALKKFYNESFKGTRINASSVEFIIEEINSEMTNERYENVAGLIKKAYSEIVRVKSEYTTIGLFYDTTRKTIFGFFIDNWKVILFSVLAVVILFFFYKKAVVRFILVRKMQNLELRRKTLKNMIQEVQLSYFQDGKISEDEFHIKTKKLAELIRDIDRQMPMLQEELIKLGVKHD